MSTFGTAVGLIGTGLAPAFWVTIASGALLGFCSGAIDACLNSHAARTFTPTAINVMHACYGIGAALSPLLITAVIMAGLVWRWAYLIIVVLQLGLGVLFLITAARWPAAVPPVPERRSAADPPVARRHGPAILGVVAILVQSAIESSLALWCFVYLTGAAGLPTTTAALTVSGYWAALCVARLLIGPIADRVGSGPVMMVAASALVIFAALLLAGSGTVATVAVIGLGIAAAPMYPLLMLTTGDRTTRIDRVVGLQTAASALGAAILPGVIGMIMDEAPRRYAVIMVVLAVLTVVLQLALRVLQRTTRPESMRSWN